MNVPMPSIIPPPPDPGCPRNPVPRVPDPLRWPLPFIQERLAEYRRQILNDIQNLIHVNGGVVLATVATSGSYADLQNKPTFAAVATSGSYADLLDKPAFAAVATSGSYADLQNKPTLAAVAESGSFAALQNKPTTLQGYGITDAHIRNKVITLGSTAANLNEYVTTRNAVPQDDWWTMKLYFGQAVAANVVLTAELHRDRDRSEIANVSDYTLREEADASERHLYAEWDGVKSWFYSTQAKWVANVTTEGYEGEYRLEWQYLLRRYNRAEDYYAKKQAYLDAWANGTYASRANLGLSGTGGPDIYDDATLTVIASLYSIFTPQSIGGRYVHKWQCGAAPWTVSADNLWTPTEGLPPEWQELLDGDWYEGMTTTMGGLYDTPVDMPGSVRDASGVYLGYGQANSTAILLKEGSEPIGLGNTGYSIEIMQHKAQWRPGDPALLRRDGPRVPAGHLVLTGGGNMLVDSGLVPGSTETLDTTLTMQGVAADAKAVGDAIGRALTKDTVLHGFTEWETSLRGDEVRVDVMSGPSYANGQWTVLVREYNEFLERYDSELTVAGGADAMSLEFEGLGHFAQGETTLVAVRRRWIPAKVSDLPNDAGYVAADAVRDMATRTELFADPQAASPVLKASVLPSYVDDVLEFDVVENPAPGETAFPAQGESGKIYVARGDGKVYRWSDVSGRYIGVANPDLTLYVTRAELESALDEMLLDAGDSSFEPKLYAHDAETGLYHEIVAGRDAETGMEMIGLGQEGVQR